MNVQEKIWRLRENMPSIFNFAHRTKKVKIKFCRKDYPHLATNSCLKIHTSIIVKQNNKQI